LKIGPLVYKLPKLFSGLHAWTLNSTAVTTVELNAGLLNS